MRLRGKSAIVTGGASGFGAGIVRRFILEGARVVIADINGGAAMGLADELGEAALGLKVDVANADDVETMVRTTVGFGGGIDILVQFFEINIIQRKRRVSTISRYFSGNPLKNFTVCSRIYH